MLTAELSLPADFRADDFLAYHARDAESVAERVGEEGIEKGLVLHGRAAVLRVRLAAGLARLELDIDGAEAGCGKNDLLHLASRMLGLEQDIDAFAREYSGHPQLGRLITNCPGLRVPQASSPYEALCWAIIGQQVSVAAAVSIRRRFILAAGKKHSCGLWCFPSPEQVGALDEDALRGCGFSRGKAVSLALLTREVLSGCLPLDQWRDDLACGRMSAEEITNHLSALKGIGPWTVSYALLRGFNWLDGSLHGDVAVRRNLARLLGREEKITDRETEAWLRPFSPWRALVAAQLWAMQAADGY